MMGNKQKDQELAGSIPTTQVVEEVNLSRRQLFGGRKRQASPISSKHTHPSGNLNAMAETREEKTQQIEGAQEKIAVNEVKHPPLLSLVIAEHIRANTTSLGQLTLYQDLKDLLKEAPILVTKTDVTEAIEAVSDSSEQQETVLIEPALLKGCEKANLIKQATQELAEQEAYADIIFIQGEKDRYYYSTQYMADNYARMLVLMHEKNHSKTIAEMVRFESETYPRPYKVVMLKSLPFLWDDDQIQVALKVMKDLDDCTDIQRVKASNDALYLFSDQHMTVQMAQGLCEWLEVEQFQNP